MGNGIKYKVTKVEVKRSNWPAFSEMRKEPGVMQALREAASEIGDIDTSFTGYDRAHVIVKTDMNTYESLIAAGKVSPKDENNG